MDRLLHMSTKELSHLEVRQRLAEKRMSQTLFEPEKRSFEDVTIELQVLSNSGKTAAEGDFRYGLAFRRSGDQYYAFTISPRTET
jgi:hypothetical protein